MNKAIQSFLLTLVFFSGIGLLITLFYLIAKYLGLWVLGLIPVVMMFLVVWLNIHESLRTGNQIKKFIETGDENELL